MFQQMLFDAGCQQQNEASGVGKIQAFAQTFQWKQQKHLNAVSWAKFPAAKIVSQAP